MGMYFVMLGIPSLLSLVARRRTGMMLFAIVYLFLVFVVGFRHHVGTDWNNYLRIHEAMYFRGLYDVLSGSEPLSFGLFWWSTHHGEGIISSHVVGAIIMLGGIFALARRTHDPWLSIVAATPYLIIAAGMSGVRQAMAAGVIFYGFSIWRSTGAAVRVLMVLLSSLFHVSALIMLVVVLLEMRIRTVWKIIGGTALAVMVFHLSAESQLYRDNIAFYTEAYVSGPEVVMSSGAPFHLLLIWIPAGLYLYYQKKLSGFIENPSLVFYGSVLAMALVPLFFVSSVGASRMTIYFYFVPMLTYPAYVYIFGKRQVSFMKTAVVYLHFIVLSAWLLFSYNSHNHIPYQNYFFLDKN